MNEGILRSEVFFFVTTISVAILTVLLAIALIYGIKILKDLKHIAKIAKDEGEEFLRDAREMREEVKGNLGRFISIIGTLLAFGVKKKGRVNKEK